MSAVNKNSRKRDWLYMWWFAFSNLSSQGGEFARTQRYKLYYNGRFYDLQEDPQEQRGRWFLPI